MSSPLPPPTTRRVRFGIPDAVVAWSASFVVVNVLALLLGEQVGDELQHSPGDFAALILAQNLALVGALVGVSRWRGRGSLRLDFGLAVRGRDWPWLLIGIGLQIGLAIMLLPLATVADLDDAPQEAVRRLEDASGVAGVVLVIGAAFVAPVVEELLFRGLLLRALLRRTTSARAVGISAVVFGLVHLADPGAAVVVPALVALGMVTGVQAVRTGSLSRPILLHVGFNLLTVLLLFGR